MNAELRTRTRRRSTAGYCFEFIEAIPSAQVRGVDTLAFENVNGIIWPWNPS
jgi:hypothetical protein